MWLEPPTVCRWETPLETKVSEKMDNKKPDADKVPEISETKKVIKKRKEKIIHDFNLLDIPVGIDIGSLMDEFVIPRIPDGYTIQINDKFVRRKSSVAMTIESIETKRPEIIPAKPITHIRDALKETESARPLHPHVTLKRPLKILECESIQKEPIYMFSKLLNDLNELCELQKPTIAKRIEEISDKLSEMASEETGNCDVESEMNYSEYSFNRMNPIELDAPKKELEVVMSDESEESDGESTSSDDISATEPGHMNRGKEFGRWSTRDVHDPKFNEDKLALQFRSGRLGYFGLAVNWYGNFPYQTWDLKPDTRKYYFHESGKCIFYLSLYLHFSPGTIFFSLTAAVVSIEIALTSEGIIMNSYQGGSSTIVQNAVGSILSLKQFKRILQNAGVNLFPEADASHYCQSISC